MAERNEKIKLIFRFIPKSKLVTIVIPDLDIPGIIENPWKNPIIKASFILISRKDFLWVNEIFIPKIRIIEDNKKWIPSWSKLGWSAFEKNRSINSAIIAVGKIEIHNRKKKP